MDWVGMKGLAAELTVHKDALHVYAAFALQVAAAALFRKSLASWIPWTLVLVLELVNEGLDIWFGEEADVQYWQLAGARHDLVNTMILPTALLLLCRYALPLFRPLASVEPRAELEQAAPEDDGAES